MELVLELLIVVVSGAICLHPVLGVRFIIMAHVLKNLSKEPLLSTGLLAPPQ